MGTEDEILLSSLKKRFYRDIRVIKKSAISELTKKELVTERGFLFQTAFGITAGTIPIIIGIIFRLFTISYDNLAVNN